MTQVCWCLISVLIALLLLLLPVSHAGKCRAVYSDASTVQNTVVKPAPEQILIPATTSKRKVHSTRVPQLYAADSVQTETSRPPTSRRRRQRQHVQESQRATEVFAAAPEEPARRPRYHRRGNTRFVTPVVHTSDLKTGTGESGYTADLGTATSSGIPVKTVRAKKVVNHDLSPASSGHHSGEDDGGNTTFYLT
jgi:hypothetical protein